MNNKCLLTFFRADLVQYNCIITNNEIREKVSAFLFKYISAESFYKKLLISQKERNGKKLTSKEKSHLCVSLPEVKRVLKSFGITYEDELIERIFGSDDSSYKRCSIKKLRDRLVHRANDMVIRTILDRYESIDADIDSFFSLFQDKVA